MRRPTCRTLSRSAARFFAVALAAASLASFTASDLTAHCQIPCGIYDDNARFTLMREHVTTIEKSMNMLTELSAAGERNDNQIARWVMNKEDHANALTDIVTDYFLAQRIKVTGKAKTKEEMHAYEDYNARLRTLHGMIVHAMKAKQTTDLEHVTALREHIDAFEKLYAHKH